MKRLTFAAQQMQLQQTQQSVNKNYNAVTDILLDSPMLSNSATVTPPASSIITSEFLFSLFKLYSE